MHQLHQTHRTSTGGSKLAIITAERWNARAIELIQELRTELAATITERADLHQEVTYWRRRAASAAGLDPKETPPRQYVAALRVAQREPYRTVLVDIDGRPCKVGIAEHAAAAADPLREMCAWQQLVAAVRDARAAVEA